MPALRRMPRLAALLLVVLATACAARPGPGPAADAITQQRPTLLLVSLDGVSPAMLRRGDTPHLDRMAAEGVLAEGMNPAYPTLTFPNHYSIVTGLRPDRHGIVHNTMRDPAIGEFSLRDRAAVATSAWWEGAEPLWVTAERAGITTAVTSWPGSEAPIQGIQPTRWSVFDYGVSIEARVDRVDGWLAEADATRPGLATLYFEHVDLAAHRHGPHSDQARDAMRRVDAALGELFARLQARGQLDAVNIVVVSDHGLVEVAPGQHLATEAMVDPAIAEPVGDGAVLGFEPRPGREAEAASALLGTHRTHACWRKQDIPAHWHFGSHPRVPPIFCQMRPGWVALPAARLAHAQAHVRGAHGYAQEDAPGVQAIFIARGPAFRHGTTLPAFDNVDLYPILADLIGVTPQPSDARPARVHGALRAPPGHD